MSNKEEVKNKSDSNTINSSKENKLKKFEEKLRKKEEELKEKEKILKEEERKINQTDDKNKFIQIAFSVLFAAAVAYLLGLLVSNVPIEDTDQWIFYSIIIVTLSIGFICYIFNSIPRDKLSLLKTILIVTTTMTIFGFSRFYQFYIEIQKPEIAVRDSLALNYNTFLVFFVACGLNVFYQGLIEIKEKKEIRGALLSISGIFIFIIAAAFVIFEPLSSLIGGES